MLTVNYLSGNTIEPRTDHGEGTLSALVTVQAVGEPAMINNSSVL